MRPPPSCRCTQLILIFFFMNRLTAQSFFPYVGPQKFTPFRFAPCPLFSFLFPAFAFSPYSPSLLSSCSSNPPFPTVEPVHLRCLTHLSLRSDFRPLPSCFPIKRRSLVINLFPASARNPPAPQIFSFQPLLGVSSPLEPAFRNHFGHSPFCSLLFPR